MLIKNYKDEIKEINAGLPLDIYFSGMPDVKEYETNDGWVVNAGYDYAKVIEKQNDVIKGKRQEAYKAESDPLFFYFQRGKKTKDEWLAKIAEIDARFPYVE